MIATPRSGRSRAIAVAGMLTVISVIVVSWAAAGADPTITARLAVRLRDETDLPAIHVGIVESARATLQPTFVGLWVRGPA